MREIKFRGKRTDNGEWVFGDLIQGVLKWILPVEEVDFNEALQVLPETVGQYSGLKDKNGTEIYEGDICSRTGHTYEIHFSEGAFGVKRTDDIMVHINSRYHGHALYNYISELLKVGNVHEDKVTFKEA